MDQSHLKRKETRELDESILKTYSVLPGDPAPNPSLATSCGGIFSLLKPRHSFEHLLIIILTLAFHDFLQSLVVLIPPFIELFQAATRLSSIPIPIYRVNLSHISFVTDQPAFLIGHKIVIVHSVDMLHIYHESRMREFGASGVFLARSYRLGISVLRINGHGIIVEDAG